MNDLTLTVVRKINATPAKVFEAWLNPEMLRRFMMPAAGMSVANAVNDPREGGRFEIVMVAGENEIPHAGIYREISPHSRIVFTWESPYSVDDSTVTLDFQSIEGGTHVTLTHVRFANEETRDNHKGGWTGILEALESAVAA